ncbi:uncharacterized protein LOC113464542 [Ceratina calcarata]|uniref:Uncharacterized protein LOC113464542 n=1 Tax=Ceratina calcarata TaxID=156304 RepID=A0AAJ7S3C5_9HYME|nr:uncharacterized protein LOC113464542 [Ceratina calcarata]
MYHPGRAAWARGVLTLGAGALFLLGCRLDLAGDASFVSTPIDSDRNYFTVAIASSDGRKKKDEQAPGIGKRHTISIDYSTDDIKPEENAETKDKRGSSYLLPFLHPARTKRSTNYLFDHLESGSLIKNNEKSRNLGREERTRDYEVEMSLLTKDSVGNNRVFMSRSTSSIPSRNTRKNDKGLKDYATWRLVQPWSLDERNRDNRESIRSTKKSFSSLHGEERVRGDNNDRLMEGARKNSFLFENSEKTDYIEKNRDSRRDQVAGKNENYSKRNLLRSRNNGWSEGNPIKQEIGLDLPVDSDRRADRDEGNYAAFRSGKAGPSIGRNGKRFSRNDGELNGSAIGERCDVKESLSREVNGRSMNEAGKSFGRSHYSDVGNGFTVITSREEFGENDDETERPVQTGSTEVYSEERLYHSENEENLSTDSSSTLRVSDSRNQILSETNDANLGEKDWRSISAERRIERNALVDDFHNSEQPSNSEDGKEEYERGEESMSGTTGMQKGGYAVFFRGDHETLRSSAETFGSRKGRATERDRGNILERGMSETRSRDRSLRGTDPSSVNFRGIDHAGTSSDGHEKRDREADTNVREVRSVSRLRGNEKLLDDRITRVPQVIEKLFATQLGNEEEFIELTLHNGGNGTFEPTKDSKSRNRGEVFTSSDTQTLNSEKIFEDKNLYDNAEESLGDEKLFRSIVVKNFRNDQTSTKPLRQFQMTSNTKTSDPLITSQDFKDKIAKLPINTASSSSLIRQNPLSIRRKRYSNYYSPQSSPVAYVHIQPAYPMPPPVPPPNRNCVKCMVVYKPCPSPPKPLFILPTYKYQDLASKWQGLKHGE